MKSVVRVVLLALVLGFTAARAEPIPHGLTETEWAQTRNKAKAHVQDIFNRYGGRVGYPEGAKLDANDSNCMMMVAAEAVIGAWRNTLPKGAPDVVRLDRAAKWLAGAVEFWCRKNGPPPGNRALQMMLLTGQAAKDRLNRKHDERLPANWRQQLDALLKKDEWTPGEVALVGTVVFVLLAREAVPIP
ncbi:hypothetical protein FJV41_39160 [Myxococcus llanfairpwllgwyngyllgogerychwyrndrobwllllantysiliogogogochensis]|uniref:Lipoprotein n=1 Tax=Myxococcus llanfairpwllgwyngyllgogerychwyrndrobwllllantysiliogogogochensis TaxID=2590453 RepID=A0A540WPX9_9BACT|nr:hypothetical protein [Myxococcus llanfairpwllgwyngyllgogerychwyrndrobwllllantysiliogogogochensis]TQF10484.1 hypothetical protein FJV41_39160 [Myxococcus llanfairpwllgwyngyllgogerychwyrndrobwllllantysiliogogogochensis]